MRVLCIVASQVKNRRDKSYSLRASHIINEVVKEQNTNNKFEIIQLVEQELKPCCMCGACADDYHCIYDNAFNEIHKAMMSADVIFVVSPHYAGIPSKLVILIEKLQELCFIAGCKKELDRWLLKGKPLGLIIHGGSTEEYLHMYESVVLNPLAYICQAVGLKVIKSADKSNGIIFGVVGYEDVSESIFPNMIYDWNNVKAVLTPYIQRVLQCSNSVL